MAERTINLGSIKYVSASTCRDDWFSLGIGSQQEPDPLLDCVFKTELFTHMSRAMPGGFNLKLSDSIEYAKKPGKMQIIKVLKDSTVREDFYKSGAIHTTQGEPANSVSRPLPKGKPIPAKPFTKGRLIRPGGPGGRPSKFANTVRNTKPAAQAQPVASHGRTATQQPQEVVVPSHTRTQASAAANRAVPPPPPPVAAPAPKPAEPLYRAVYDFEGQSANELSLHKDDVVTIVQKENNGKTPPSFLKYLKSNAPRLVARETRHRPRLGTLRVPKRRVTTGPCASHPTAPASTSARVSQSKRRERRRSALQTYASSAS